MRAREAIYRLECPRCAGIMTAVDGASAIDCPFCRARYFLPDEGNAGWLVEPRTSASAAVVAAKRWLRENHRRVTSIGEPRSCLTPSYWSRANHLCWELATMRRGTSSDPALAGLLVDDARDSIWEPRFRAAFQSHVLPVHPLSAMLAGSATRAASQPLVLFDPDRLPEGYEVVSPVDSPAEAEARARVWHDGRRRQEGNAREDELAAVRPAALRLNLLYLPVVLVPYAFREDYSGWVVVDAVAGRAIGDLSEAPPVAGEPELQRAWQEWGTKNPLIPLECAGCGWELAWGERDRLHQCVNCGVVWELVEGARRRVRQWVSAERSQPTDRWLPFWVFGEGGSESSLPEDPYFVPAYRGRHLARQLHVAVSLRRHPPSGPWDPRPDHTLSGATVGSDEAEAWLWAVSGAVERESLKDFLAFLRTDAQDDPGLPSAGVAWLPFARQGGDLVCRQTGLRTRALGTIPWGAEPDITNSIKTAA